jgi:3-methyladenine DNA glycosylase/8-oxoguanine DNA glycosylase
VRARLPAPAGFSFARVVSSHGWYDLPPFSIASSGRVLSTVVALPGGGARRILLRGGPGAATLETPGSPRPSERRALVRAARRILSLDLDLSEFHDAVRADERFGWIATSGTGRMLRAPSMFEDLVKLVLTTNCSWGATRKMVTALVERYGEPAGDGTRAFPTPARLAHVPERTLRGAVRAGYRSPYLAALAREVASGRADVEAWDRHRGDPAALRKEVLALPGVGPYVAENILKFLGRPDGLALDSWMRAKYARLYHDGRPISDKTIARRCAAVGRWAGLALWFDLTRDWFDDDDPAAGWATLS